MDSNLVNGAAAVRAVRRRLLAVVLAASAVAAGCASVAGRTGITAEQIGPDRFVFRIHVGGLAEPRRADARAREEIESFRAQQNYLGYEILERHYNLLPPYYEYTVRFSRKP